MQRIEDMSPELVAELYGRAGLTPVAKDGAQALFDRISGEQAQMIAEAGPVERPEPGEIKSVGGVDYQITPKGWKKIGLTPVTKTEEES